MIMLKRNPATCDSWHHQIYLHSHRKVRKVWLNWNSLSLTGLPLWRGQIEVVLKHSSNRTSFESRCTILHNELSHTASWQQGNNRENMSAKNDLHCCQIGFTCFLESKEVKIAHKMQFCDFLTTANASIL